MAKNEYYVHPWTHPREWDPLHEQGKWNVHTTFFGRVLVEMEKRLAAENLTFVLTWKLDVLPRYGQNVVVILMGDEFGRVPTYARKVLVVFKTLGARPYLGASLLNDASYANVLAHLGWLRNQVARVPNLLKARLHAPLGASMNVFEVPLGYGNQDDSAISDVSARSIDVFFSGSINNQRYPYWSPQRWLCTPKAKRRQQMAEHASRLRLHRPDLNVKLDFADTFVLSDGAEPAAHERHRSYSDMLMDSKICLVPRGTTLETTRIYEGLRYGCVPVTDTLPDVWYLRDAPVFQVRRWEHLESIVDRILSDQALLRTKHEDALAYWQRVCSEAAVGRYMASTINRLLATQTPSRINRPAAARFEANTEHDSILRQVGA